MIKKLILLLIFLPILAHAQAYDRGVFGTESVIAEYDTLGASDDSVASRIVYWRGNQSMRGSLTVWGKMWLLSGDARTMTVKFSPLYENSTSSLGAQQTLGTVTVTDSANYEYNVAGQSWWRYCIGYKLDYVPDATGSQIRIRGRELAK